MVPRTFYALRSRNLRLFFFGQSVSLIGTWISIVASSWLVYRLSNSEFLLGVVAFSGQFPMAVVGPFAGAKVDSLDKRRVLLITQSLFMLQSLVLGLLTITGQISISWIITLNVAQALINAFDMPARQTLLPELVQERGDLPNAIALHAAIFHGARLIGPAIAGVMIGLVGEGACFLLDAASYAAVLLSITLLRGLPLGRRERHLTLAAAFVDGIRYVRSHERIRDLLLLIASISFVGVSQFTLLPVFARDVYAGGPELYGMLSSALGLGAFLAAMLLASRSTEGSVQKLMAPMPTVLGGSLMLFAISPNAWFAMGAVFVVGIALISTIAGSATQLQMLVDDQKRARVMSLYAACFFGLTPVGGLIVGALATHLGAPVTVFIGGMACLLVGIRYLKRVTSGPSSSDLSANMPQGF